jgi:hypothetical protein
MKVKIWIETYPAGVTTKILTGAEMETWKMKTSKNNGTWFSYETTKTISQVIVAFATAGYDLEEFPSVTFERD